MMPLWKRLISSILDKITILILFVLVMMFIQYTPYTAAGHLGRYVGMMSIPPSHYENIDKVSINKSPKTRDTSEYFQKRSSYDMSNEKTQSCRELDLTITIWFVFINILYFLVGELLLGASLFKAIMGGKLSDYNGNKLTALQILSRNIVFGLILIVFVVLRFVLNISYLITIFFFFFIYDSIIFKSKQNVLDKITKCYIKGKKYYRNNNAIEESNQSAAQIIGNGRNFNVNSEDTNEYMIKEKREKPVITYINKTKNKIFWFVFLLFTLYPIHNILSYYFGDYYAISNYDMAENLYSEKESDNYIRKKYENETRSWNEFPKEQFAISRQLSRSNSVGYWANPKYGPVPEGVPVSTYEGNGTDSYIAGYNDVKRFFWEEVSPRTLLEVYNPKKKKVYYTTTEPYYRTYSYRNSISTYAISAFMSFLPNCESRYVNYLNNIAQQLNAAGISWNYINVNDKTAIAYCNKEHNVRRVIVCANGNAYLLETEATEHLREQSDLFLSSVSLNHYHIVGEKWEIIIMFCMLILCVTVAIVTFVNKQHSNVIHNRYAYSLFCLGISSIVICFVIAICQSYMLYTDYSASCSSVFGLIVALTSVPFIITPLCLFYYRKTKERWKYDYIVPSFLEKAHLDFIKSDFKKKIYISYICYPTMILSLLPFGFIIVLLIFVPILLVITFVIWFNKWHRWVKESKMPEDITMNN